MKKILPLLLSLFLILQTGCSLLPEDKAGDEETSLASQEELVKESASGEEEGTSAEEQESSKENESEKENPEDKKTNESEKNKEEQMKEQVDVKLPDGFQLMHEKTDFVALIMESGNPIIIQLRPDIAPISSENFQNLVEEDFYKGIIFHRVIKGFMIQGGDPTGTGTGGSEKNIKGEFAANGVENKLSHKRGVVSMARRGNDNDSASSQFFICHADSTFLDGEYAAFGTVVYGMDEVDRIADLEVDGADKPLQDAVIERAVFVQPTA